VRKSVVFAGAILDRLGVLKVALAARRRGLWPRDGLTVVLYHRVVDPSGIEDMDPDMIDATPAEFDVQMKYLREHFQPVTIDEVLETKLAGRRLPPDSVLVSFDDGYRDNYEHAMPILQKYGMKGLFFVTTGHLTERRLFWWEHLNLLVRKSQQSAAHLNYPAPEDLDLSTAAGKSRAVRRLNRIVKDHFDLDLDRFIAGVAAACGVDWGYDQARALADRALMTWDQVKEMRRAGMGIGSHTHSHRVLQTLPAADLAAELRESRKTLEAHLGEPVTTIAYPVGKPISEAAPVRQAVADAGYQLGFTTKPGINRMVPTDDPLDLHRLTIDRGVPAGVAHTWLTFPSLAR
jgi:peptidoglycan/xylan/chitin deacetylase (PgdA/CDA1 family)